MYVLKRDGRKEPVSFDKITSRIKRLSWGLPQEFCDPVRPRSRSLQLPRACAPCSTAARADAAHAARRR